MKILRPAFTIIEIIISVLIFSLTIIFALKVHSDNREHIIYISERNKLSLQDSLYLGSNILNHHKDTKTAYEILENHFKIKELKSREILKQNTRDIFIPEEINIIPLSDVPGPTAIVNKILLKDTHSSIYYRLKINSF